MASTSVFRIQRDLRDVHLQFGNDSENPPIFAVPAESSVEHCYALIVGPPDTPYANGFFLFDIRFPTTYPNSPPMVRIVSTDCGSVRMNPNLYAQGRVCLSILGTWRGEESGAENWRSSYSLGYVLQCIQCIIMNGEPYHNEPGFEKELLSRLGTANGPRHNFGLVATTATVPAVSMSPTGNPGDDDPGSGIESPAVPSPVMSPQPSALNADDVAATPEVNVDASPTSDAPPAGGSNKDGPLGAQSEHSSVSPSPAPQHPLLAGDGTPLTGSMSGTAMAAVLAGPTVVVGGTTASVSMQSATLSQSQPSSPNSALPAPSVARLRRVPVVVEDPDARLLRLIVLAKAEAYAHKIQHETLRHTVCDVLESLLGLHVPSVSESGSGHNADATPPIAAASAFKGEIKRQFLMRIDLFRATAANPPKRPALAEARAAIETTVPSPAIASAVAQFMQLTKLPAGAAKDAPYATGDHFEQMPFEMSGNSCMGRFNYPWLARRLTLIADGLAAETEAWRQRGRQATAAQAYVASSMADEAEQLSTLPGVCGGPKDSEDNAFEWTVSLMPADGIYEDSMYNIDIVFDPEGGEPPRVRFVQPIFHPNVSPSGVPFIALGEAVRTAAKRYSPSAVVSAVHALLVKPPMQSPAAALNTEAAALCFSPDTEKQREFRKQARRLARRTVE